MRRLARIAFRLVIFAIVVAVFALGGFRVWSMVRETSLPEVVAGPDAHFVKADGLEIHYTVWGPDDGQTLMLVHGTAAWSQTFRDIAAPLGRSGYRVIAPDLPPFGFSQRPADSDYSRAAQAKRLLAFADALGLERFVLGVHSYGGGAAIEAAFTRPERIDALILLDVALGLGQTAAPRSPIGPLLDIAPIRDIVVAATLTNPLMIGFGLRSFIHHDVIVTEERIALYARPYAVRGTTEAVGEWMRTGLYGDERASLAADPTRYRAFDRPVLVIWGSEDTVTPLDQGEAIAAAFPNSELEVLEEVNHIPHVERPDDVVALIEQFLEFENLRSALKAGALRGTTAN